eukprot:8854386-Alexandrium_andersonii.AAC.1
MPRGSKPMCCLNESASQRSCRRRTLAAGARLTIAGTILAEVDASRRPGLPCSWSSARRGRPAARAPPRELL